jgi:hypothetical protein
MVRVGDLTIALAIAHPLRSVFSFAKLPTFLCKVPYVVWERYAATIASNEAGLAVIQVKIS